MNEMTNPQDPTVDANQTDGQMPVADDAVATDENEQVIEATVEDGEASEQPQPEGSDEPKQDLTD